jgi:transcriptional regulator with XRE-family HTH domain
MSDPSLGTWLRKERERRGISLKAISDQTKVSAPLLEGLEADNLARWPEGIYRRAFVRAYATAVGLDPDEVSRRFEQEHGTPAEVLPATPATAAATASVPASQSPLVASALPASPTASTAGVPMPSKRARTLGTLADLTVALVLALASAAAGSRLLWPVLLIAAYYALGILLTGTSPMVALLSDEVAAPALPRADVPTDEFPRPAGERRHQSRRNNARAVRATRAARQRVQ